MNKRRSDILTAVLALCAFISSQSYEIAIIEVPPALKPWLSLLCGAASAVSFAFRNQLPVAPPTPRQKTALAKLNPPKP